MKNYLTYLQEGEELPYWGGLLREITVTPTGNYVAEESKQKPKAVLYSPEWTDEDYKYAKIGPETAGVNKLHISPAFDAAMENSTAGALTASIIGLPLIMTTGMGAVAPMVGETFAGATAPTWLSTGLNAADKATNVAFGIEAAKDIANGNLKGAADIAPLLFGKFTKAFKPIQSALNLTNETKKSRGFFRSLDNLAKWRQESKETFKKAYPHLSKDLPSKKTLGKTLLYGGITAGGVTCTAKSCLSGQRGLNQSNLKQSQDSIYNYNGGLEEYFNASTDGMILREE